MPSVLDTPELVTSVDTSDLTREPRARHARGRTRPGWWRTLVQRMVTSLTPAWHECHGPAFETALDRFVREYPSLSLYALALI
jgi:hypothetical protein